MEKMEKKSSGFSFNPFLVLVSIVVLCAIASYVVAPGAFDRQIVNGLKVVVPNSFHSVDRTPVSLLQLFMSIPAGLEGAASLMFVVMIVGGVVEIYNKTGAVGAAIKSVLSLANKVGSQTIIAIIMLVFAVIGGILGWSEQIIPFVPIIVSLCIALGYDSLVGMAISGFACLVTFAVGPFNIYTVGISDTIAGLPMFSGWQLRLAVLGCVTLSSLFWILRYAAKIKKDPSKSLMKEIDTSDLSIPIDDNVCMDPVKSISLIIMVICFAFTIYGLLQFKWGLNQMAAIFLMGGVVVALINKMDAVSTVNALIEGAKAAFPGALIIGVARSIQWVMGQGGLVDPLVYNLAKIMGEASAYTSAVGMFIMNFFINALIPSGSGQAMAVMPIMIPLADMLGITRQTAVLAFQFGDGISNTLWFTNGTLLIYCSLAKVPLKVWYKFILPLQFFFFAIQLVFLYFAVSTGYGPF